MEDEQVKEDKPKKKASWTAPAIFSAGALAALCGIWVLMALYPPLAGWNPTDAFLRVSEVVRNLGLVVAAVVGFGIAIWRGTQTDEQISQTRDQFEAKEDTDAAQRDQDIYREASQLLANENSAISYAGLELLIALKSSTVFGKQASQLILNFKKNKVFLDANEPRDELLIEATIIEGHMDFSKIAAFAVRTYNMENNTNFVAAIFGHFFDCYFGSTGGKDTYVEFIHCVLDTVSITSYDKVMIGYSHIKRCSIGKIINEIYLNDCLLENISFNAISPVLNNYPNEERMVLDNCCIVEPSGDKGWNAFFTIKNTVFVSTVEEGLAWLNRRTVKPGLDPHTEAKLSDQQREIMRLGPRTD